MATIALKIICSLAALFGVCSVLFLWPAFNQGVFSNLETSVVAVKVGGIVIRAVCLILCMWAAWRKPHIAVWFAWVAFLTFAVGGYAGSGGHLLPFYYGVVAAHALFVFIVRALAANCGPSPIAG